MPTITHNTLGRINFVLMNRYKTDAKTLGYYIARLSSDTAEGKAGDIARVIFTNNLPALERALNQDARYVLESIPPTDYK